MIYTVNLQLFNNGANNYEAEKRAKEQIDKLMYDLPIIQSINIISTKPSYTGHDDYISECIVDFEANDVTELDNEMYYNRIDYVDYQISFSTVYF